MGGNGSEPSEPVIPWLEANLLADLQHVGLENEVFKSHPNAA
jgi:hypothetical protein